MKQWHFIAIAQLCYSYKVAILTVLFHEHNNNKKNKVIIHCGTIFVLCNDYAMMIKIRIIKKIKIITMAYNLHDIAQLNPFFLNRGTPPYLHIHFWKIVVLLIPIIIFIFGKLLNPCIINSSYSKTTIFKTKQNTK